MPVALVAALVAAGVSGAAATLSFVANRRNLEAGTRKFELEQQRRLTEKLLDLRLASYPKAFEITEQLRGEHLFKRSLSEAQITIIRDKLVRWHGSEAGFLLSERALHAWYQLRDALASEPRNGESYSKHQIREIWSAKNQFRGALRGDIGLLYIEDEDQTKA